LAAAPLLKVNFEFPMTESLVSLIVLSGFFVSIKALKTERTIWYIFAGCLWGLSYLTRLETWIFITPLILLTLLKLINYKKEVLKTVTMTSLGMVAFLVVAFPYLSFTKEAYGSWTLNAKIPIYLSSLPTSIFGLYQDQVVGLTTPAQVFYSGNPYMYTAELLHPPLSEILLELYRGWSGGGMSKIFLDYLEHMWVTLPQILILGLAGILISYLRASGNPKNIVLRFCHPLYWIFHLSG